MDLHRKYEKRFRSRLLESSFYIMHPSVIFLYYVGLFSFAFMYNNPAFIATVLIFSVLICLIYIGQTKLISSTKYFVIIGIAIIFLNPLLNHRGANILFYFMDKPVTLEAFIYGVLSSVTIFTMFIAFMSFNKFIDSERFLFLFSKLSPKISFITNMSLRFNSIFKKRAKDIVEVQSVRGIKINNGSILNRIKTAGLLLEALTNWCLEEGMIIAEVLKSKQYGNRKRKSFTRYKFVFADGICAFMLILLLSVSFFLSANNAGSYSVYPRLKPIYFDLNTWIGFGIMLAFLSFPFVLEIGAIIQRRLNYEYS